MYKYLILLNALLLVEGHISICKLGGGCVIGKSSHSSRRLDIKFENKTYSYLISNAFEEYINKYIPSDVLIEKDSMLVSECVKGASIYTILPGIYTKEQDSSNLKCLLPFEVDLIDLTMNKNYKIYNCTADSCIECQWTYRFKRMEGMTVEYESQLFCNDGSSYAPFCVSWHGNIIYPVHEKEDSRVYTIVWKIGESSLLEDIFNGLTMIIRGPLCDERSHLPCSTFYIITAFLTIILLFWIVFNRINRAINIF